MIPSLAGAPILEGCLTLDKFDIERDPDTPNWLAPSGEETKLALGPPI